MILHFCLFHQMCRSTNQLAHAGWFGIVFATVLFHALTCRPRGDAERSIAPLPHKVNRECPLKAAPDPLFPFIYGLLGDGGGFTRSHGLLADGNLIAPGAGGVVRQHQRNIGAGTSKDSGFRLALPAQPR